jgi:hypothetical protein
VARAAAHTLDRLKAIDRALRIGAKLGLQPTKEYLHAGTRVGARTLGLDWRAPVVDVRDLPRPLRTLAPHEIEDVLCVFKSRLVGPLLT